MAALNCQNTRQILNSIMAYICGLQQKTHKELINDKTGPISGKERAN